MQQSDFGIQTSEFMNVAFLGLGNLGRAIAKRIKLFFGKDMNLFVWSRNRTKVELFVSETSAVPLKDLSDIPKDVEFVLICLFDSDAVASVIDKIDVSGKILVDLTTNHPKRTPEFYNTVANRGGSYLESPVLGSVIPAMEGRLTVLVAGEEKAYLKVQSILSAIASKIFFFGNNIPNASKMKLVNNLVLGGFMAVLAEALAVGEKLGLSKDTLIDVLSHGAGRSAILDAKRSKLVNKDFSPHFSVALIRKDLDYLIDYAFASDEKKFLAQSIYSVYDRAKQFGLSQLDFSSVYLMFEKILKE
ncbi:MAG: NAD(P)-dependent oxidoreductase [Candidatus Calescibacterium sp.]|nr:NAD(P)-dependent oxidoreductase [Candidatus Calescibacterium sp.]